MSERIFGKMSWMRWAKVEILHFSILLSHLIPVLSTWVCQVFMIDICSWWNLYPALTALTPFGSKKATSWFLPWFTFNFGFFYIILVNQITGLLVLSSLSWSCGIVLATQRKQSQERTSLTISVSKVMRFSCVLEQYGMRCFLIATRVLVELEVVHTQSAHNVILT